ncbi:MAG TPA: GNAT family N-acetyltransferase [Bacillales bacterium]|nr:GNAT family N-acetyltransferase [Bacillales bacterium]
MMEIKEIDDSLRPQIREFVTDNWGSPVMISRGKSHSIDRLPGFITMTNGQILGLITYHIEKKDCEIISLDSLQENCGIGTRLVERVVQTAKEKNCRRIWLITSNDNIHAIRFYQKRGFDMVAVHVNAIVEARAIKPEIPEIGNDGIPIRHEIEFEFNLSKQSNDRQESLMKDC